MPFDAISCFVEAKPFGLYARITSVLHRLRINDDQRCPFGFFSTVAKLARVAEIQDEQGNQQGNVENAVVQPD